MVLITSVLGASADWLAQALIKEALTAGRPVVFVAFMRDWGFHVECVRKLVRWLASLLFVAREGGGEEGLSGSNVNMGIVGC